MSLEVVMRHVSGVAVFDLAGRLVMGGEGDTLRETLLRAYEQGNHWMLLNCEGLIFVDSSGLGDLVSAYATIVRRGGMLRLLNPTQRVSDLLAITGLDAIFDIHSDELIALQSFNSLGNARTQQRLAEYLDPDA